MTDYVRYITKQGDRWDQIAEEHYGNPYQYEPIIRANRTVPITTRLPAGIELAIPIITTGGTLSDQQLPPWKRQPA